MERDLVSTKLLQNQRDFLLAAFRAEFLLRLVKNGGFSAEFSSNPNQPLRRSRDEMAYLTVFKTQVVNDEKFLNSR